MPLFYLINVSNIFPCFIFNSKFTRILSTPGIIGLPRRNVPGAACSGEGLNFPKLLFQCDVLTDVRVRSAQWATECKGPNQSPQAIERAGYSCLRPPCFSLACALCSEFKFHIWTSSGNLSLMWGRRILPDHSPSKPSFRNLLYSCQMESIRAVVRSAIP